MKNSTKNDVKKLQTKFSAYLKTIIFFSCCFMICAAQSFAKDVTGKVVDNTGAPLQNVSVLIKNTSRGTTTDANGSFSISVPNDDAVLVISYVGFATQELPVKGISNLDVRLLPSEGGLNDVVVVGYGTQRKVTVTGAVATVKGSDLEKVPVVNLSNTLVGRLPGVTAINSSGEPGYDGSNIKIRGTNAFGNTSPLIVIDGVPERTGGLDRLNPSDIESVSVLKDAAAAIYGQRAANGVILITTKRGKSGKPSLTYDFNQGWADPTILPKMMNVLQYAEVRNELAAYDAPASKWADALDALHTTGSYSYLNSNNETITISSPTGFFPEDIVKYKDGSDPWGHTNTNWFKDVLKKWSPQQRHNLQINGGTDNIKYLVSLGYLDQDGYYKHSATGFKQYDFRTNLDAKINKYVTASIGLTAREEYRFFPTEGAGSIFRMLMRGRPNEPAIWPNGLPGRDIENGQNPVVITTNQTGYDKDKRDYIQTNGKVEIQIPGIDGLKITGTASLDKYIYNGKRWATPWYLYSWDRVSYEDDGKTPKLTKELRSTFTDPRLSQNSETSLNTTLSALLNYDHKFGDHSFSFLAGLQKEKLNDQYFNAYRRYFISTAVDQLFAGGDLEKNNGGGEYNRARLGYFGRLGYNYKEKYILEFLGRYDGSYIFPKDHRFGFFPGLLGGWRVSEEDFFKSSVKFINNLKVRGSWGKVGAEPYINGSLAEYQYLSTYGFSQYIIDNAIARGLYESILPNPDFTWEVQTSINLGIEGALLNNKISFEFDYFKNKRDKALFQQNGVIPGTSGLLSPPPSLPPVNYAKLSNKGWEFKVGYNNQTGLFKYSISVNGGYAKNKIDKWNEADGVPEWQRSTGRSFGSNGTYPLVYLYDGVFATQKDVDVNTVDYSAVGGANLRPGDMKFKDIAGRDANGNAVLQPDGKIDGDDRVRLDQTRDPTFTGGLNINLAYKNFDCSILFQGAKGGILFVSTESGDIGNYLQYDFDHRWTVGNPSSVYPRIASRDNTYYTGGGGASNTYRYKKTDYLRFKNFEIGYTVPSTLIKRIGINNIRVYANGINIKTWNKLNVFDPEAIQGNGQYYPQSKIINVGASITF